MRLRYGFRLYPNDAQRTALARASGCARVVFNDALRAREDARAVRAAVPHLGRVVQAGHPAGDPLHRERRMEGHARREAASAQGRRRAGRAGPSWTGTSTRRSTSPRRPDWP
ncbi:MULTISPECIES: helix-turn-helix domain-containing protein [Streptomyces]|uniref:helix-turn-helix domain-containing protein n=1 Tax=Streptomyces TaxID=1883 RepID=UPI001FD83AD0|nr:helix-turn-helix domain-containing protein [Streptomyces durhamensis]